MRIGDDDMKYIKVKHIEEKISVIALGCWKFGGGAYWGGHVDEKVSMKTVDTALDYGINYFDTAESYNDGAADLFLGRAMKGRRDKFIVSTKFYLDKLHKNDVLKTCEDSLKRLQTDYIDVLSPHFPSREVPFEETFEAFDLLRRHGKVRSVGLSNFGASALKKIEAIGRLDEITLNQLPYSILWRAIEYDIENKTNEYGIGIICYSTLAQGLLSGKYDSPEEFPENLKVLDFFESDSITKETFEVVKKFKALCRRENLEMAPTALAWLLTRTDVVSLLTGASVPDQLVKNIKCLDLELSQDIIQEISAISDGLKQAVGNNADMWNSPENNRIY